jgi:hypothetical protein
MGITERPRKVLGRRTPDPGIQAKRPGKPLHMPRSRTLEQERDRLYMEAQPRPERREPMVLGKKPPKPKVSKAERQRSESVMKKLKDLFTT